MQKWPRYAVILPALLLVACVSQNAAPPVAEASCTQRAAVARQLAELHQYGGDMQAHIADLARRGASGAELSAYQGMAQRLAAVPMLAGDGGREMGVELSLAELDLRCAP